MKKDLLWILAIIGGFIFGYGVVGNPIGLGLFIFVNFILFALYKGAQQSALKKELPKSISGDAVVLTIIGSSVLLSFAYLYRIDPMVIGSVAFYHFAAITSLTILFIFPGFIQVANILDLLISGISLFVHWIIGLFTSFFSIFTKAKESSNILKLIVKIVIYVIISAIIFIIFAGLLSNVDPKFKVEIDRILEYIKLDDIIGRAFLSLVGVFTILSMLKILAEKGAPELFGSTVEKINDKWSKLKEFVHKKQADALLPLLISIPILLLFALFVSVQFTYLFGKDVSEVLKVYTFAEYARRGFSELLMTIVLTYPVLAVITNLSRSKENLPRYATLVVNLGISVLVMVMLYSGLLRMSIYAGEYGPSVLRNYVVVGSVFIGIGMIGYAILATIKAIKSDFSFIKSFLFGDFAMLAYVTMLGVLFSVTLYPWNSHTLNQIKDYYYKTDSLDIYQLIELPIETEGEVYEFADSIEKRYIESKGKCSYETRCPNVGIMLLKAHSFRVQEKYKKQRDNSIFTKVFGFNVAGELLLSKAIAKTEEEKELYLSNDKLSRYIDSDVNKILTDHYTAIADNNFSLALGYWDPMMKPTTIKGLSSNVRFEFLKFLPKEVNCSDTKYNSGNCEEHAYEIGRILENNDVEYFSNSVTATKVSPYTQYIGGSPVVGEKRTSIRILTKLGLRNGRLVIVDSTIPLAYLPDSVSEKSSSSISQFGYRSYRMAPSSNTEVNKEVLFDGLTNNISATDFVTE